MIALLVRRLTLTLFLAFLIVACLEEFNPAPPRLLIDFHRADYRVCATVHNGPVEPPDHCRAYPYHRKADLA